MNEQSLRTYICLGMLICFAGASCSQPISEWKKDSISTSLSQIFPNATKIELQESDSFKETDSLVSGWDIKASILENGNPDTIFFYFYQVKDTSFFRRRVNAAINSAFPEGRIIPGSYSISFPFTDSVGNRALVYKIKKDKEVEYLKMLERKIIQSFNIPHYNTSIKIEDVTLEEVDKDEPPPPPPPPPKLGPKKKGK